MLRFQRKSIVAFVIIRLKTMIYIVRIVEIKIFKYVYL